MDIFGEYINKKDLGAIYILTMLPFIYLVALLLCVSLGHVKGDCASPDKVGNQADYYWRDYFGMVPKDAVPGGYDETGNITYIGQLAGTKHVGIFPGNLHPGQREAVASIGSRTVDGTYVKILCSNPSNKFEWISTNADESQLLTDYHWVIGGSQSTIVTYIGRATFEGRVQIGRVFDSKSSNKGLWLSRKSGGSELNFKSFELMVLPR